MKKHLRFLFFIIFFFISFSAIPSSFRSRYKILTLEDRALEYNQERPALETAIGDVPHRESYNRWLCFENTTIDYGCYDKNLQKVSVNDDDHASYTPHLFVDFGHYVFQFEEPAQYDMNRCLSIILQWDKILKNQSVFCTFAAIWPPHDVFTNTTEEDPHFSYWNLYGLKSSEGRLMAEIYDETSHPREPDE